MTKKKILEYSNHFFPISETFIYRQVVALEDKFQIVLVAKKFENEARFPLHNVARELITGGKNLSARLVNRILRTFKFHSPFSLASSLKLIRLTKGVDLIHAHYGWNGLHILSIAKKNNIPLVVSFHGKDASASLDNQSYRKRLPELFSYASAIIVCSPHMRNSLPLSGFFEKLVEIPYGVDATVFSPLPTRTRSATIRILHVGRIVAKKGVTDLIRVFARLAKQYPEVSLGVLGDGDELEECKAIAAFEGIESQVIFYGAQSSETVKEVMSQSDIFVLNSRTDKSGDMEGLPNVLLEAMSLELPVVSTLHAGIPSLVESNVNGLLVPEKDNQALYDALETLVLNEDMRKSFGQCGRKTILERYTIEKMQYRLVEVFNNVTKKSA
jgi:colanic acid/amylovoran biosynthesis glycosyltransferase